MRARLTHRQVYYHLEYVGVPRSYKWHNSNSCVSVLLAVELANLCPGAYLAAVDRELQPRRRRDLGH